MGKTAPFHSHKTKIAQAAKLLISGPRIIAELQGNVTPPCIGNQNRKFTKRIRETNPNEREYNQSAGDECQSAPNIIDNKKFPGYQSRQSIPTKARYAYFLISPATDFRGRTKFTTRMAHRAIGIVSQKTHLIR